MAKPFHILLTDAERATLETVRRDHNLKSAGEAVRWLICRVEADRNVAELFSAEAAAIIENGALAIHNFGREKPSAAFAVRNMTVKEMEDRFPSPSLSRAFTNRLKGEWKPK